MSGNHHAYRAVRWWEAFFEWRKMKTMVLATTISILLIFFNEVLAK